MTDDNNIKYYNNFNMSLVQNIKKSTLHNVLNSPDYNYEYFNDNNNNNNNTLNSLKLSLTNEFNKYKNYVLSPQDDSQKYKFSFYYFDKKNKRLTKIDDVNIKDIKISVSTNYRINFVYNVSNTENIIYNFFINRNSVNNHPSKCSIENWAKIVPSTVLDLCKRNINDEFYYDLLGYNSITENSYPISRSELGFDASTSPSVRIVCSVRLINSKYSGPCMTINGKDIYFNKKYKLIDYKQLENISKPMKISKIYNQMNKNEWFSNESADYRPELVSHFNEKTGIKKYYIKWTKGTYLKFNKSKLFKDDFSNLKTAVSINLGGYNSKQNLLKSGDKEKDSDKIFVFFSSNFGIYSVKDNTVYRTIGTKYTDITGTSFADDTTYSTQINNFNINTFNTISCTNDYVRSTTSQVKNQQPFIDDTQKTFKFPDTKSEDSINFNYDGNNDDWIFLGDINNKLELEMSELIVFTGAKKDEDTTQDNPLNVSDDILDKIAKDNFNMWKYRNMNRSLDLRCNDAVREACKLDFTNDICRCYNSYKDSSSYDIHRMTSNLEHSGLVNTDANCINPGCDSLISYINPINKNYSICSSTCSSILDLETENGEYINLKNANIVSNCKNKSFFDVKDNCKDNNTCLKSNACNLKCKENENCVIRKNKNICVSKKYSTKTCSTTYDCDENEICDDDTKLCLPDYSKTLSIVVIVFCFVAGFIISTALMTLSQIVKNSFLKIFIGIIVGAVVALVYYLNVVSKKNNNTESFQSYCKNTNDCHTKNSECKNGNCSCVIGYNLDNCEVNKNKICTNLSYLPDSSIAGSYFYITTIDNILYAFSSQSTFKFNNNKWDEIKSNNFQNNFSPFTPQNYSDENQIFSNNMMTTTYQNSVYIFSTKDSLFTNKNSVSNDENNDSLFYEYNKDLDTWLSHSTSTKSSNIYNKLYIHNDTTKNYILTVLVNENIYIFGGLIYNKYDKSYKNNNTFGIFSTKNKNMTIKDNFNITPIISSYAKGFISNDGNIYIIGMKLQSSHKYGIYKFGLEDNKFTLLGKVPKDLESDNEKIKNIPVTIYYFTHKEKEYISFLYYSKIDKKITITLFNVEKQQYTEKIPEKSSEKPTSYSSFFNGLYDTNNNSFNTITDYVELNDLLFLCTKGGEIIRCDNYKYKQYEDAIPINMINISPCFGASNYSFPVVNQKICDSIPKNEESDKQKKEGWYWSNKMCSYYKGMPNIISFDKKKPTCRDKWNAKYDEKNQEWTCYLDANIPKGYFYCDDSVNNTPAFIECLREDGCKAKSWTYTEERKTLETGTKPGRYCVEY